MFRRPHQTNNRFYTDDDLEKNGGKTLLNSNENGNVFKLMTTIKKMWNLHNNLSYQICQEPTNFVVKNKPIFDNAKLVLIKITAFLESDIKCGTVSSFKKRTAYTGAYLNDATCYEEWNKLAIDVNDLLLDLNKTINVENSISQQFKSLKLKTTNLVNTSCSGHYGFSVVRLLLICIVTGVVVFLIFFLVGYTVDGLRSMFLVNTTSATESTIFTTQTTAPVLNKLEFLKPLPGNNVMTSRSGHRKPPKASLSSVKFNQD